MQALINLYKGKLSFKKPNSASLEYLENTAMKLADLETERDRLLLRVKELESGLLSSSTGQIYINNSNINNNNDEKEGFLNKIK